MTPASQFELHPDAESLNAFVEHLLPAAERETMLAHLATCARCRQITFLAQEAVDADAQAAAPAASRGGLQPAGTPFLQKLWTGWRPVVVLAGACTVLAAFTVIMLPRHADQNSVQNAQVAPNAPANPEPAATSSAAPPPKPAAPKAETPKAEIKIASARAALPSVAAPPSANNLKATSDQAAPMPTAPAPLKAKQESEDRIAEFKSVPPQPQPSPAAAVVPQSATETVTVTALPSQPEPTPPLQQVIATQQTVPLEQIPAKKLPSPAYDASVTSGHSATHSGFSKSVGALSRNRAAGGMASSARPAAPASAATLPSAFSSNSAADTLLTRQAMQSQLPSGLKPIAAAAAHSRVLALDAQGVLFRSDDGARLWQPVATQWKGRIITVRTLPAAASKPAELYFDKGAASSGVVTGAAASHDAAPAPPSASLFEIVNTDGGIWRSIDGQTWKSQQPQ